MSSTERIGKYGHGKDIGPQFYWKLVAITTSGRRTMNPLKYNRDTALVMKEIIQEFMPHNSRIEMEGPFPGAPDVTELTENGKEKLKQLMRR